ncbi:MAG: DUF1667 domain-containing protein [Caldilineaceae bacterium]|nr:DUF1667 domain-containing protein [Caldilineaceae bacterium]
MDAPVTFTYLCIGCPLGCRLEVDEDEDTHSIVEVRGFSCRKGKEYALQEHERPLRMVTTTVDISGGPWPRLPVRTSRPVPKEYVVLICDALRKIHIAAPVHLGDIIACNVLDSGADIVAACDMPAAA